MIQKKICMIGNFAVGKTSLVARFVHSIFSDNYLSTVGVKVDRKQVAVEGTDLNMILWDIEGKDDFGSLQHAYLRGAAGYFLVADGTRADTLSGVVALQTEVENVIGPKPFVLLVNKQDLSADWEVGDNPLPGIDRPDWGWLATSAKSGLNVEQAFEMLAKKILEK